MNINHQQLINLAIQAALNGNWSQAVDLNKQILKNNKSDLEAWLRLGKAQEKMCLIKQAKSSYRKVLKADHFNQIAKRNLDRLADIKTKKNSNLPFTKVDSNLFLEEPGKTKIISLIRLTTPAILKSLETCASVNLFAGQRSIIIKSQDNKYLGRLPDDLALRLNKLIARGNRYLAVIKSVDKKNLQIYIKEIFRSKKNQYVSSFPSTSEQYHAFIPTEVIKEEE